MAYGLKASSGNPLNMEPAYYIYMGTTGSRPSSLQRFTRALFSSLEYVYLPISWAKFPSRRADFPPVWDDFPYVFFILFFPSKSQNFLV